MAKELETAILKTLLYGDIFDFPMTPAEIHHFLIGETESRENVEVVLHSSAWLAQRVIRSNGYYATRPETPDVRHYRALVSDHLWEQAQHYGVWLAHLPFVRMVALTGALALRNASDPADDLDYLIVTTPGRVWLTRLIVIGLVRLAKLWGVKLCPNYMTSLTALEQQHHNLYIAHEIVQMVPISGHEVYHEMRRLNQWADGLIPNAEGCFYPLIDRQPHGLGKAIQRGIEWLLAGRVGEWLENWERRRKQAKFTAEIEKSEHSAAELNVDRVKGHFQDYGHLVLDRFSRRLQAYKLDQN